MLDVPKGNFSVKRVNGICRVDKNCCFDIRGLKHMMLACTAASHPASCPAQS